MSQLSMFDVVTTLDTFDDVDGLLERVREGETDEDLFSYNDITFGRRSGRSYSFYGTKVFEFIPKQDDKGTGKIKVCSEIMSMLGQSGVDDKKAASFTAITLNTEDDVIALIEAMKARKHSLFRNLITETFGCCNDFMRCSEAEKCIHQNDRFYNGCAYRVNLEQGKIFYGPKRNVD